jgi:hypothetical protein
VRLNPKTNRMMFAAVVAAMVVGSAIRSSEEIVAVEGGPSHVNGLLSEVVVDWIINSTDSTTVQPTPRPGVDVLFTLTVTAAPSDER